MLALRRPPRRPRKTPWKAQHPPRHRTHTRRRPPAYLNGRETLTSNGAEAPTRAAPEPLTTSLTPLSRLWRARRMRPAARTTRPVRKREPARLPEAAGARRRTL